MGKFTDGLNEGDDEIGLLIDILFEVVGAILWAAFIVFMEAL